MKFSFLFLAFLGRPKENSSEYTSDGEKIFCGLQFTQEGTWTYIFEIIDINFANYLKSWL